MHLTIPAPIAIAAGKAEAMRAARGGTSKLQPLAFAGPDRRRRRCFYAGDADRRQRQWRQRSAGLRTNVLVAIGAAAFVSLGMHLNGNLGAAQIAAYVVSGIGFLGAGVIMKEGAHVWGLNTAATLWCSAAVGALSGVGLPAEAAVLTLAVLAGNTLLRPLANVINRAPVDEQDAEATYEIRVATRPDKVGQVRDLVSEALEKANYPIRRIEVEERSADSSEIVATLVSTSVDANELNAVANTLERSPLVAYASWTSEQQESG
jgi:putative Mg2+ transporter-C (MgtC) family protein